MFTMKTLLSKYYSQTCLKPPININPCEFLRSRNHAHSTQILKSWLISFLTQRPISVSAQPQTPTSPNSHKSSKDKNLKGNNKKPLDVLFKEAVGLCERREIMEIRVEQNGEDNEDDDGTELKNKLWELEMEIRQLKVDSEEKRSDFGGQLEEKVKGGSKPKPKSLITMFGGNGGEKNQLLGKREGVVLNEISPDMQVLLRHLYDKGYFRDGNFLPRNLGDFDVSYFNNVYARDFMKFAVERFGGDNQEISKWISGSDLRTIALFGCPSQKKREVFAAKRLRTFFEISEESVCDKCSLKESCKFVNQSVWKSDTNILRLDLLMRLLSTYSMEDAPPQLKLTDDVKACVSRLMHEIINLSKNT